MGFWRDRWNDIRGNFVWQVIVWVLGGGLLTAAGQAYRMALNRPWETKVLVAVFLISSLGLAVVMLVAAARSKRQAQQAPTQDASTAITTIQPANVDEFYRTYDNRLLLELEQNLRAEASKFAPADREKFLVRYFASTMITGIFEYTWVLIFRSQLLAMQALNQRSRRIHELQPFYDEAITAENFVFYSNYPFTSWLAFMKSFVLVREDGDVVSITIRGQEFLKYLIHTGRSADGKQN